ncbi:MAG: GGDEF domain-containing protein [Bdellovibrionales bacterium]
MFWSKAFNSIFNFKKRKLENYFDDLELEKVIPQLIQYVSGQIKCSNVIWVAAAEYARVHSQEGGLSALEPEQAVNRQMIVQSRKQINDIEIFKMLLKFSSQPDVPQLQAIKNENCILLPLIHHKTKLCMAYLLFVDVAKDDINFCMNDMPIDLAYLAKHISFSMQYWDARKLTYIDDLTGLYNQKYMRLVLETEISRAKRDDSAFSVLFMDLDYFKSVNDTSGHLVGSQLLIEIGKAISSNIRRSDYAFRYGGDEYVLVLPGTAQDKAELAAERIRSIVEKTSFIANGVQIKLTFSIGLASYPTHAQNYEDIIRMADAAMYHGKNKSRNIVYVAS